VPTNVIDAINEEIANVRGVMESGDAASIKAKTQALQQALMKIGESLSNKGGDSSAASSSSGGASSSTYDADVKDEKK
jgi:molecular chaperone DnaK